MENRWTPIWKLNLYATLLHEVPPHENRNKRIYSQHNVNRIRIRAGPAETPGMPLTLNASSTIANASLDFWYEYYKQDKFICHHCFARFCTRWARQEPYTTVLPISPVSFASDKSRFDIGVKNKSCPLRFLVFFFEVIAVFRESLICFGPKWGKKSRSGHLEQNKKLCKDPCDQIWCKPRYPDWEYPNQVFFGWNKMPQNWLLA